MIHRLRMWWWERRYKQLVEDLRVARDAMDQAAGEYRHDSNYTNYSVWECFSDEVTSLSIAIAQHETRIPKR